MQERVIIWGASGGIGGALARLLQRENWQVLGVTRSPERLADTDILTYAADFGRDSDMAAAALWAAQEVGEVDLWVYAAGEMLGKPLADTTMAAWTQLMTANVGGAHAAIAHALPLVRAGGHLVFTGAYVERILLPNIGAYAAGKAALDAYAQVLAKEQRDKKVTIVRMGAVDTPLWDDAPFKLPRGALQPDAVAEAILHAYRDGHKGVLAL